MPVVKIIHVLWEIGSNIREYRTDEIGIVRGPEHVNGLTGNALIGKQVIVSEKKMDFESYWFIEELANQLQPENNKVNGFAYNLTRIGQLRVHAPGYPNDFVFNGGEIRDIEKYVGRWIVFNVNEYAKHDGALEVIETDVYPTAVSRKDGKYMLRIPCQKDASSVHWFIRTMNHHRVEDPENFYRNSPLFKNKDVWVTLDSGFTGRPRFMVYYNRRLTENANHGNQGRRNQYNHQNDHRAPTQQNNAQCRNERANAREWGQPRFQGGNNGWQQREFDNGRNSTSSSQRPWSPAPQGDRWQRRDAELHQTRTFQCDQLPPRIDDSSENPFVPCQPGALQRGQSPPRINDDSRNPFVQRQPGALPRGRSPPRIKHDSDSEDAFVRPKRIVKNANGSKKKTPIELVAENEMLKEQLEQMTKERDYYKEQSDKVKAHFETFETFYDVINREIKKEMPK